MKPIFKIKGVCLFASLLFAMTGSNAQIASFLWSNGATTPGINVNPVQTTTYYVTITQNGFQYYDSLVVFVDPLPAAPQVSSNSPVALGGSIQLSASTISGASYNWTGPNGFSSNLQNPIINNADTVVNSGSYSATVTVNGCISAPASTQVEVYGTILSLSEEKASGIEITAFPNPFSNFTTLSIESELPRFAKLDVYDINGRLITSEGIFLQKGISLRQLYLSQAIGNYMIVLNDATRGKRLATLKLLKE